MYKNWHMNCQQICKIAKTPCMLYHFRDFVENRDFYRATRMHSADYAVARCPSVCPCVRLSHAGIESKRLYISSKFFFSPRVAPPFKFSHTKRNGNIPTGTPVTGASNARWYEKITIFDQYHALSRKWCKTEP